MNVRVTAAVTLLALSTAACGSGESILLAGNDPVPTAAPPAGGPTQTTAMSTAPTDPDSAPVTTVEGQDPVTTPPVTNATTTTTPLSAYSECPTDALDDVDGPVEVTFWHGLNGDNEAAMNTVTDAYNASQDRVRINAQNQGGYGETIDKYVQSSQDSRPDMVMFPEYVVQRIIDSESVIPVGACIEDSGLDTSPFQPSTLLTYDVAGVQWSMPFNVSNPILYYNRAMFVEAGLDPDAPPQSLQELRDISQQLVDTGASATGIALDTGTDSGGGWFIEQWFANAGELYADNGNGRLAPATQVLYDDAAGVELLSFVQGMITDGLAFNVGDNAGGTSQFLKLADANEPAAMTIGTSAALRNVINVIDGGLIPGRTGDDIGIGPLPGPGPEPSALVGGASLYVVDEHGDEKTAAVWDFITYLVSPEVQSEWATITGYVPIREDAIELEPLASLYDDDPRFRVAYDQLVKDPTSPAQFGPILGPQREVRTVTARAVAEIFGGSDVQTALTGAAQQANALIADYNSRN